ncbi:MAG: hypothetical protein ACREFA_12515, partial [Stellaceae bacterium]
SSVVISASFCSCESCKRSAGVRKVIPWMDSEPRPLSTAPLVNTVCVRPLQSPTSRIELRGVGRADTRASGYRGLHLAYRYKSDKQTKMIYNGLKIEIQLRSQYQHAWATTVETVGTFIDQALKSSIGPDAWLRFFQLMGTAIAMREGTPAVPGTTDNNAALIEELSHHAANMNVAQTLGTFSNALRTLTQPSAAEQAKAYYYLIRLDARTGELTVSGFRKMNRKKPQNHISQQKKKLK